ncbi:MAG: response regulator [Candidatus Omnitrophica bacterium]|nr:response regulator [Candidatus Omnitrophota bacterium]
MKILVVDNEKRIVALLKKFLVQKGHSVDIAYDGKAALELIKEKPFDIAFLDEDMPGLTGLEIAEFIKHYNLKIKSILLTGYPCLSKNFSKTEGADEYLEKPMDLDKVEEIVNKYKI